MAIELVISEDENSATLIKNQHSFPLVAREDYNNSCKECALDPWSDTVDFNEATHCSSTHKCSSYARKDNRSIIWILDLS